VISKDKHNSVNNAADVQVIDELEQMGVIVWQKRYRI
jgi:hypothetical protein